MDETQRLIPHMKKHFVLVMVLLLALSGVAAAQITYQWHPVPIDSTWDDIKDLRATTDSGVKAMWLSDKLSNLRSLYEDWRKKGDGVWQIFNQKAPAKHAWLYKSIIECLGEFKNTPEYNEYNFICQEIFGDLWK